VSQGRDPGPPQGHIAQHEADDAGDGGGGEAEERLPVLAAFASAEWCARLNERKHSAPKARSVPSFTSASAAAPESLRRPYYTEGRSVHVTDLPREPSNRHLILCGQFAFPSLLTSSDCHVSRFLNGLWVTVCSRRKLKPETKARPVTGFMHEGHLAHWLTFRHSRRQRHPSGTLSPLTGGLRS
jgi:hypothetical protein